MKKTLFWVSFLGVLFIGALVAYQHLTNPLTPQEKAYLRKMKEISNLYKSAQKYSHKNKFKEAIETYRQILSMVPGDLDAKVNLATHLAWDKQYDEAQKTLQEVFREKPDYLDAHIVMANIYAWQGDYEKSIETFNTLLKSHPNHEHILMGLAQVYRWQGNREKMRDLAQEVLKINPKHPEAQKLIEEEKPK